MRSSTAVLIASGLCALLSTNALAWCDMTDFNKNGPPSPVSDVNDSYADIKLEWGSDVDPYQGGERAWHYVRNLHDQSVSVDWPKTGILVPFDNALPKGKAQCEKERDSKPDSFSLDTDAPMWINSYPKSAASAFLKKKPSGSGGETATSIETGYTRDGVEVPVYAEVVLKYLGDRQVEMSVTQQPGDIGVALSNSVFGLDNKILATAADGAMFAIDRLDALVKRDLIKLDDISGRRFAKSMDETFFILRGREEYHLTFNPLVPAQAPVPILLIAPDGKLIAAGRVFFDGTRLPGFQ